MKIRGVLSMLILLLFLIGCTEKPGAAKSEPVQVVSVQGQLVGEWYNLTLDVDFNAGDTATGILQDMHIDSTTWESTLQIKPILTDFRADSTWTSVYRNLADSIVRQASGVWWMEGDTLIFRTILPEPAPDERFAARVDGDIVTFSGLIDFDQDGSADDKYEGTQRRNRRQ